MAPITQLQKIWRILRVCLFLAASLLGAIGQASASTDWSDVLSAAKREGTVTVAGPVSAAFRLPLTTAFEAAFPDIKVEFTPLAASALWPRVTQEREAGKYLWDVVVNGPDSSMFQMKQQGVFVDVREQLVLPEVVSDKAWSGGFDALFQDKEKRFVAAFLVSSNGIGHVNRDFIKDDDLGPKLIDPSFKGKIAFSDPRVGGKGQGELLVLFRAFGEKYVANLLQNQDPVVTTNPRQLVEWLVRGQYPIAIGASAVALKDFQSRGLGTNIDYISGINMKMANSSAGAIALPSHPPHPNATKVYINWLLTPAAQEAISKSVGYNSRRADVPFVDPDAVLNPTKDISVNLEESLSSLEMAAQLAKKYLR
jgi:iron(III) transport system substrate-binding protein